MRAASQKGSTWKPENKPQITRFTTCAKSIHAYFRQPSSLFENDFCRVDNLWVVLFFPFLYEDRGNTKAKQREREKIQDDGSGSQFRMWKVLLLPLVFLMLQTECQLQRTTHTPSEISRDLSLNCIVWLMFCTERQQRLIKNNKNSKLLGVKGISVTIKTNWAGARGAAGQRGGSWRGGKTGLACCGVCIWGTSKQVCVWRLFNDVGIHLVWNIEMKEKAASHQHNN